MFVKRVRARNIAKNIGHDICSGHSCRLFFCSLDVIIIRFGGKFSIKYRPPVECTPPRSPRSRRSRRSPRSPRSPWFHRPPWSSRRLVYTFLSNRYGFGLTFDGGWRSRLGFILLCNRHGFGLTLDGGSRFPRSPRSPWSTSGLGFTFLRNRHGFGFTFDGGSWLPRSPWSSPRQIDSSLYTIN